MTNSFKWVLGYEGLYKVNQDGQIFSMPRNTTKGGFLKPYTSKHNGYVYVCLSKNDHKQSIRLHRVVMEAWVGKRPSGMTINHKDGNKQNNKLDNLEYCTQSQNQIHAVAMGLQPKQGIPVIDLDTLTVYDNSRDASMKLTGSRNHGELICRVCRGKRSHYRNHRFAFLKDYNNNTIPAFSGKFKKKASNVLWR